MKNQLRKFLESDRNDYTDFIENDLTGSISASDIIKNRKEKEQVVAERDRPSNSNKWMPNGVFGTIVDEPPYQELDFEKFSFTVLKHLADNPRLIEFVKALQQMPETGRRKKLRIYMFESLKSINSPFFDMNLYYDILEYMVDTLDRVQEIIEREGYIILTKGFDSFSFQAPTDEAERLQERINSELEVTNLQLETKKAAVKFYNIADFLTLDGEWYRVKVNGTRYDEAKECVVTNLRSLDYGSAFECLSEGKGRHLATTHEPDNVEAKFQEYAVKLREIQQSDNHMEQDSR